MFPMSTVTRTGQPGPNTGPGRTIPGFDPLGDPTSNAAAVFAADIMADEQYKALWSSPQTIKWIATWYVTHQNTWPTVAEIEVASKRLGENFRFSPGGGGSGVNRANSIRSLETTIFNQARSLGMELTPEEVTYFANVAFDLDYSSEQLVNSLVTTADWQKINAGTLSAAYEQIRNMASNYLLALSDQTLQDYAKRLNSNQATVEGIESFLRAQSKAANPWLAEYIDQGINPGELLRSARDQIATSLQLNPNDVNFSDSRFMDMVTVDDNGATRLANAREISRNIRSDKDWAKTDEAAGQLATVGRIVGRIFGKEFF